MGVFGRYHHALQQPRCVAGALLDWAVAADAFQALHLASTAKVLGSAFGCCFACGYDGLKYNRTEVWQLCLPRLA